MPQKSCRLGRGGRDRGARLSHSLKHCDEGLEKLSLSSNASHTDWQTDSGVSDYTRVRTSCGTQSVMHGMNLIFETEKDSEIRNAAGKPISIFHW